MNNKDLKYLLDSVKNTPRNRYKNISIGTNSSHINFLKRSNIKYNVKELSASEKEFSIFDLDGNFINSFVFPFYPNTTKLAYRLTRDKFKLEDHLTRFNFSTTISRVYGVNDVDEALNDFINLDSSDGAVIKPLSSSLGKGVFVNVPANRFKECWKYSIEDLSISEKKEFNDLKVIVQNYIPGFEARATVLQGNLVSIIARIPPYITGDGEHSIKQLIEFKNNSRKDCKYLSKYPIRVTNKVKEFLLTQNITLDDIPTKDEPILLSSVSNINAGGEMINITNMVSQNIKDFALDVLASIPGMYSGGLDLMLTSYNDINPHILEINTYPVISLTKYPTYGKQMNPSKILFESLISQYQLDSESKNQYEIDNRDRYLKDFIDFTKRRMKFI